jgi:hypothetical protein
MRVEMVMEAEALRFILIALMAGVDVEIMAGRSVRETMRELGLTDEESRTLVRTVFLDGRPVDDFDATSVAAGASLALGAAMPGLVGAVLRSGSPFSVFREDISAGAGQAAPATPGRIKLKVFNLVAEALMPRLLARGICLEASRLERHLAAEPHGFWASVTDIRLEGAPVNPAELLARCRQDPGAEVRLTVRS